MPHSSTPPNTKGKGKVTKEEVNEVEDEEDDEMDEDEDDDDDDDDDEDEFDEIDPQAVLPSGRRTRGVRVDYSSAEALRKAGLKPEDDGEDEEESFIHEEDTMKH